MLAIHLSHDPLGTPAVGALRFLDSKSVWLVFSVVLVLDDLLLQVLLLYFLQGHSQLHTRWQHKTLTFNNLEYKKMEKILFLLHPICIE